MLGKGKTRTPPRRVSLGEYRLDRSPHRQPIETFPEKMNQSLESVKGNKIDYSMKKLITKMQRFLSIRPTLIEDFVKDRVSAIEFVECLQRLPPLHFQGFMAEWAGLFKIAYNTSSQQNSETKETPIIPPKSFSFSEISFEERFTGDRPMTSKSTRTPRPSLTSISAHRTSQRPAVDKINIGQASQSPTSSIGALSPRSASNSDTGSGSPCTSPHISLQQLGAEKTSSYMFGGQSLPPVKSNYAEAKALLQPYVKRYMQVSSPTSSSSHSKEESEIRSRSPSGSKKTLAHSDEKQSTKTTEPPISKAHLLRGITALAFASDTTHAPSHEASRHFLALMNGDQKITPQSLMSLWGHFNRNQQQRWMRAVIEQFYRVNNSLFVFSKITEETNFRRALNQMIMAVSDLLSTSSVSIYSMETAASLYSSELKCIASTSAFDPKSFIPIGMGFVGRVALDKQMIHVQNARTDSRYALLADGDITPGNSLLSIPIMHTSQSNTKNFYILHLCSPNFSPEDILLIESLSMHIAILLNSVQSRSVEIGMREKFQAMVEISNVMSSQLELQALINVMRQKSKQLLDADRCTLFFVDHETKKLWTRIEEGQIIEFPMNSGIVGFVVTSGETVNITDAYKDPRFRQDVDIDTGYRTKSILCMPVRDKEGIIIAAIQMINKASGVFQKEDEQLLSAFCAHAAVAIVNSRVHEKETMERKKFQALSQIMKVVSSEIKLEPLIDILRQKSKELLDSDKCTLFLIDAEKNELYTRLQEGMSIRIPLSHGIAGHVATTGEVLNIPDAYADSRFNKDVDLETGYKTNNILCMPVKCSDRGEIVGAIQMVNKTGRPFGTMDEELLQAFSSHAAVTITKAKLFAEALESQRKLERILRGITNYVMSLSATGTVITLNRSPEELFEATTLEIRSKPIEAWAGLEMNSSLIRDFHQVVETLQPVKVQSYILNKGHANERIINYSISPLVDEEEPESAPSNWTKSSHSGFLMIMEDISDFSSMRKTIFDMESKIGELRNQVTSTIEAPIQVVFKTIERLSTGQLTLEQGRKELLKCVKRLGKSDLFQPDLTKLLHGVCEETKQMILLEYSHELSVDKVDSLDSWPSFEPRLPAESLKSLTWEFDALDHPEEFLVDLIYDVFEHFNLVKLFHIPVDKLRGFVRAVRSGYRKNPFHNFYHAFTVLQVSYLILVTSHASNYLRNIDILAILVAALCHDLDHPGVNNGFEVNSQSELAMLYNDLSVQENHHCHVGFTIMKKADCNILMGLSSDEYKDLRKVVVSAILSTDMAQHFEMTTKLKGTLELSEMSREHREFRGIIISSILHSADLSNPVRPWRISSKWSRMLREEFSLQVSKEKDLSIPVTSFMVISNDAALAKNEIGFIDFVVRPWWETMISLFPDLKTCLERLSDNREQWKAIVEEPSSKE